MKVNELFEAKKEKYDHMADTDEEGNFKSKIPDRKYDEIYKDVKKTITGFIIGRMKKNNEDAAFLTRETDQFHSGEMHSVTSSLEKRNYEDAQEAAFSAVEEIVNSMKDHYGDMESGSSLTSMYSDDTPAGRALKKKLEKRIGVDLLDMENSKNTNALEAALDQIPEFAESKNISKWHNAKHHVAYMAKQKSNLAAASTAEGLKKAVDAFDHDFVAAFGKRGKEAVANNIKHGYTDWGITKDNHPKTADEIVKVIKAAHGLKAVIEWVATFGEGEFDKIHNTAYGSKKIINYIIANSKKLEPYK